MKVIMVDLDGTLVDTNEVNYLAYSEALCAHGYKIEKEYYYNNCNGRYYLDFLPEITTQDRKILEDIHKRKKEAYSKYLNYAKLNLNLVDLIKICRSGCRSALVTTASKKNTYELLEYFSITDLFDLILTRDDIVKSKPDPQGYLLALNYFDIEAMDAVVFEDSPEGVQAAERAGCDCYRVIR